MSKQSKPIRTAVKVLLTADEIAYLPSAATKANRIRAALAEWREMKNEKSDTEATLVAPDFAPLAWGKVEIGDEQASNPLRISKMAAGKTGKPRRAKKKRR